MRYITIKRFKRIGIEGNFNIPYGTELESKDGWLYYKDKKICSLSSAVMRDYFTLNEDNCGLKRGKVTTAIINKMQIKPNESKKQWQSRWDIIWQDKICQKYKKDNSDTTFLWSLDFYNAPLLDLYYIAQLVGVKENL